MQQAAEIEAREKGCSMRMGIARAAMSRVLMSLVMYLRLWRDAGADDGSLVLEPETLLSLAEMVKWYLGSRPVDVDGLADFVKAALGYVHVVALADSPRC